VIDGIPIYSSSGKHAFAEAASPHAKKKASNRDEIRVREAAADHGRGYRPKRLDKLGGMLGTIQEVPFEEGKGKEVPEKKKTSYVIVCALI
jgi:hypothetical protein